MKIFRRWQ